MARVEASGANEAQVQSPEALRLLESHIQVTARLCLSSPKPGVPYRVGEEVVERRIPNKGFFGETGGPSIVQLATEEVEPNEWGISTMQKHWGIIEIQGRRAYFETQEFRDLSIAYLVEDRLDACSLADVIAKFPEYTQEQIEGMAKRGIKGVVKTRTGIIRHYKEGDSLMVYDKYGITSDSPSWHQVPL